MATTCVTCNGPITSHGRDTKQCQACWQAARIFCPTCGKELDKRIQRKRQCRACWLKAHPVRVCQRCAATLAHGTRSTTSQCRACRSHPRAPCVDCGKPLISSSRETIRCWSCHVVHRGNVAIVKHCSVVGCLREHKAKGLCLPHYQTARRRAQLLGYDSSQTLKVRRGELAQAPCQVCGYDRLPSHLHRIIPGSQAGMYVIGNVATLCARCHEEVHRGLIPCPPAFSPLIASGSAPSSRLSLLQMVYGHPS